MDASRGPPVCLGETTRHSPAPSTPSAVAARGPFFARLSSERRAAAGAAQPGTAARAGCRASPRAAGRAEAREEAQVAPLGLAVEQLAGREHVLDERALETELQVARTGQELVDPRAVGPRGGQLGAELAAGAAEAHAAVASLDEELTLQCREAGPVRLGD